MTKRLTLVPAYGRDYKSKKAVQADLAANKDFTICDISCQYDGKYANLQDLKAAGYEELNVRYKRLTMVTVIKMSEVWAEHDRACQEGLKAIKAKFAPMTVGAVLEDMKARQARRN